MRINNPIEAYIKSNLKVGTKLITRIPPIHPHLFPNIVEGQEFKITEVSEFHIQVSNKGTYTIEKDHMDLNWESFFKIKL